MHRDYSELGPVSVQLSEDRFRLRSPGGFPAGITLQNFLDDSKPRSPIPAEAFKRAGIVDRAGRGIREMYLQLLRTGRGVPDYSATNTNAVIMQISTSDADLEMVRFVLEYEDSGGRVLLLPQLQILHELKAWGPRRHTNSSTLSRRASPRFGRTSPGSSRWAWWSRGGQDAIDDTT